MIGRRGVAVPRRPNERQSHLFEVGTSRKRALTDGGHALGHDYPGDGGAILKGIGAYGVHAVSDGYLREEVAVGETVRGDGDIRVVGELIIRARDVERPQPCGDVVRGACIGGAYRKLIREVAVCVDILHRAEDVAEVLRALSAATHEGDGELGEFDGAAERALTNGGHALGHGYLGEPDTVAECLRADGLYAARYRERGEPGATRKRIRPDLVDVGGDGDRGQPHAPFKRARAYHGDVVIIGDGAGLTTRDDDVLLIAVAVVFHDDVAVAVVEIIVAVHDAERGDRGATRDDAGTYRAHAGAYLERFERGATFEGIVPYALHTASDGDRGERGEPGERIRIDVACGKIAVAVILIEAAHGDSGERGGNVIFSLVDAVDDQSLRIAVCEDYLLKLLIVEEVLDVRRGAEDIAEPRRARADERQGDVAERGATAERALADGFHVVGNNDRLYAGTVKRARRYRHHGIFLGDAAPCRARNDDVLKGADHDGQTLFVVVARKFVAHLDKGLFLIGIVVGVFRRDCDAFKRTAIRKRARADVLNARGDVDGGDAPAPEERAVADRLHRLGDGDGAERHAHIERLVAYRHHFGGLGNGQRAELLASRKRARADMLDGLGKGDALKSEASRKPDVFHARAARIIPQIFAVRESDGAEAVLGHFVHRGNGHCGSRDARAVLKRGGGDVRHAVGDGHGGQGGQIGKGLLADGLHAGSRRHRDDVGRLGRIKQIVRDAGHVVAECQRDAFSLRACVSENFAVNTFVFHRRGIVVDGGQRQTVVKRLIADLRHTARYGDGRDETAIRKRAGSYLGHGFVVVLDGDDDIRLRTCIVGDHVCTVLFEIELESARFARLGGLTRVRRRLGLRGGFVVASDEEPRE